MKASKTVIQATFALIFGMSTMSGQAAVLNSGDILTISPGITAADANGTSGLWAVP